MYTVQYTRVPYCIRYQFTSNSRYRYLSTAVCPERGKNWKEQSPHHYCSWQRQELERNNPLTSAVIYLCSHDHETWLTGIKTGLTEQFACHHASPPPPLQLNCVLTCTEHGYSLLSLLQMLWAAGVGTETFAGGRFTNTKYSIQYMYGLVENIFKGTGSRDRFFLESTKKGQI